VKFVESLLILLILAVSLFHVGIVHADSVEIHGYVNDDEGNPVEGVFVEFFSLNGPPWIEYGRTITNSRGHYEFSLERPEWTGTPRFFGGLPIHEGCDVNVGWPANDQWKAMWVSSAAVINTEGMNTIQQDFVLMRIGVLKLTAYSSEGALIHRFPESSYLSPVYTTDLNWKVIRSSFVSDRGILLLGLNVPNVVNIPWEVPGFGKVILRADNGGKGFTFTTPAETTIINLNYELAKTEFRILRELYADYLSQGYTFEQLGPRIEKAASLLQAAGSTLVETEKARYSDLCLNQTLWANEEMEIQKALQDIDKYRKGNALIRIIDENGQPLQNTEVEANQVSHDFLFGSLIEGSTFRVPELFVRGGMNVRLLQLYWQQSEEPSGSVIPSNFETLRNMGVHFGAEGLVVTEPSNAMTLNLLDLTFDQVKNKIYEHVHRVVAKYAEYVDYWIAYHNPHMRMQSLGFSKEQITDLVKTAIGAVREADPTAQVLIYFDHPCGFLAAMAFQGSADDFTTDPYTFAAYLKEMGIGNFGIALAMIYGSEDEYNGGVGPNVPYPFRDLSSISRILDWYGNLSVPVYITEFNAPGQFTSPLGYWHKRSWDESLKSEWIEKFYTIAFSKTNVRMVTYWSAVDAAAQNIERGLLDAYSHPRQSYYTVKRLITDDWTTRLRTKTDANGQVQFRGFAGNYTVTIGTKNGAFNFTIHVNEQASQSFTVNLGRANAEHAIAEATEAVNKARREGRTIFLDKAEDLLEDSQKALSEANYDQATVLAEEANQTANGAMSWLIMPAIAVAGVAVAAGVLLRRRAKRASP